MGPAVPPSYHTIEEAFLCWFEYAILDQFGPFDPVAVAAGEKPP